MPKKKNLKLSITEIPLEGHYPFGIKINFSYYQLGLFLYMMEIFKPSLVIELGYLHGGVGSFILENNMCNYVGFDITDSHLDHRLHRFRRTHFKLGNVFESGTKRQVEDVWNRHPPSRFLFCDNGNKKRELRLYHWIVGPDDFLLVHDYPREVDDSDYEYLLEQGMIPVKTDFKIPNMLVFTR